MVIALFPVQYFAVSFSVLFFFFLPVPYFSLLTEKKKAHILFSLLTCSPKTSQQKLQEAQEGLLEP